MIKKVSFGLIRTILYVIVFIVTFIVVGRMINQGSNDMTSQMPQASLPTVSFIIAGEHVNPLYGYATTMDTALQREVILPIGSDRKVEFQLDKFGQELTSVDYQVRSLDGSRLIEDSKVTKTQETKTQIFGEMILKDLIEAEKEYELVLIATLKNGKKAYYYTRILPSENLHITEKLQFIADFHAKTFDKEAASELTMYLESNKRGDNTTLGYVNIHSSLNQVTFAECPITRVSEPNIAIKEIDESTGSFQIKYLAMHREGKQKKNYLVKENYRIRYSKDRMYLLDYERTMDQLFDEKAEVYGNGKIELGIQSKEISFMEADGGNVSAFVVGGSLYSFIPASGKLAVLYSFFDEDNWDIRTVRDAHDIQILNVDETGNVQFMVYGYINRGIHEGYVGIELYQYDASLNTIEEMLFIPYNESHTILEQQLARVNYLSNNGEFFFLLDDSIYGVDLNNLSSEKVATNLKANSFQVSVDDRMFAWQEFSGDTPTALRIMNLTTMDEGRIEAGYGRAIIPLGFMDEDIIYGVAYQNDIWPQPDGEVLYLMHEVRIENAKHQLLKRYEPEDCYVTDCEVRDNQIVLSCVKRNNKDQIVSAPDAQIMSKESTKTSINTVETVVTERYEKITQLAFKKGFDAGNLKILTPKEVLYEGSREVSLERSTEGVERYYVFHMGDVISINQKPGPALKLAYEKAGCVVCSDGSYIWRKTARSTKNQIMAIKGGVKADEKNGEIAICLDAALELKGISRSTQAMLDQGQSPMSILTKLMLGYRVLDISGNGIDTMLYYVNKDYPIIAISKEKEKAYLIIGYNEYNTVLMDPKTGTVYKKGLNDSKAMFEDGSYQFITYLPLP